MGKFENLSSAKWPDAHPSIVPASVAFKLTHADNRFFMVTWWEDEPVGVTLFEFTGVNAGSYEIRLIKKENRPTTALEFDEWVLVFNQYFQ